MMIIFWDRYGILLTEYLPHGTKISGVYYASITEWLCCAILEKRYSKVLMTMLPFTSADCYSKDWLRRMKSSSLFSRYCIVWLLSILKLGKICSCEVAMMKQSILLRIIWITLIENLFVKAYKVCVTGGSMSTNAVLWSNIRTLRTLKN